MEKEKGSETAEIRFLKVSHELESIKQRSYGNHIMSTAYHLLQSNKRSRSNWKMGNAQEQRADSSGSTALQRSLCFHYHILSCSGSQVSPLMELWIILDRWHAESEA